MSRYRITIERCGVWESWEESGDDLLAGNADDEEFCIKVAALQLGQDALFGGGDGLLCRVERIK